MVSKGARHIVLLSRSGSTNGKADALIKDMHKLGAAVIVRACDVADKLQVNAVIAGLAKSLPVRGLIHAAMVLVVRSHFFIS